VQSACFNTNANHYTSKYEHDIVMEIKGRDNFSWNYTKKGKYKDGHQTSHGHGNTLKHPK
jgi:hypothetical protein